MAKRYPQAILVSCEIPWDENEELIEDTFRREIRVTLDHFNHLYVFGTAGEGYAVTLTQFKEIVGIFHEETDRPDVHPMVGVIGMSTAQVVEKIGAAYDVGFRVFQIALPPWGALNDNEYMTYFTDVCRSFPDASFLHYNLPRSKRVLVTEDYMRLEDTVPNLVATKYTSASLAETFKLVTQTEIQHFLGERNFGSGCLHGECALLASWGLLFPKKIHEFFEFGITGQFEKLFRRGAEIDRARSAFIGAVRDLPRIDGAFDKMIVRASGIDMPLRLLSPYESIDLESFDACLKSLREQFPDWL